MTKTNNQTKLHKIYEWASYKDVPCDHLTPALVTVDIWLEDKEYGNYSFSFDQLKEMINNEFSHLVNPRLVLDYTDDGGYYGGEYIHGFKITHEVPESDDQFVARKVQYQKDKFNLNNENKKKNVVLLKKEEKERKEFERLKKIYG